MAAASTAGSSSRAALPALAFAGFVLLLLAPAVAGEEASAPPGPLEFHVGGPRGWRVPDGNTSYGWWATNNRFRVGDRLREFHIFPTPKCLVLETSCADAAANDGVRRRLRRAE